MTSKKTKLLAILVSSMIIMGGAVAGYYYLLGGNDRAVDRGDQETEVKNQDGINYQEPTEDQKQHSESKKEQLGGEDQETPPENQGNNQGVDVVLTRVSVSNGLVTAAGYVDINRPGTCTLVFTASNGTTKQYSDPTQEDPANPENENCSNFRIPKSELSGSNQWTAQLSYSSDGYKGASQKWEFEL